VCSFFQMSVGSFQMCGSNFELFLGLLILRKHLKHVNLFCSVAGLVYNVQHSLRKLAGNAIPCMGSEALPIYLLSLEGTFIEYVWGNTMQAFNVVICEKPMYVQIMYIPHVCIANVCWHG
jgi:hypothetical protein